LKALIIALVFCILFEHEFGWMQFMSLWVFAGLMHFGFDSIREGHGILTLFFFIII